MRLDSAGIGRDCELNGKRYPLVRDKERGIAWWHEEDEALSESLPQKVAKAIWEQGFFAGAGEGTRLSDGTAGYAFTAGFDCMNFGVMRFSGRRLSLTPTRPTVDKPTHFEEALPTSTGVVSAFTFTKSTTVGTTTQTAISHGLSVAPKAIILYTAVELVTGTVATHSRSSYGFTDGTRHGCTSLASFDAQPASSVKARYSSTKTILIDGDGSDVSLISGAVTNITATTFDINWTQNDTGAYIIHGVAIGGEDISAYVKEWQTGTSIDFVAVTGVGFQPEFTMHLPTASTNGTTQSDTVFGLGCVDLNGNQWAASVASEHNADPTNTKRTQVTNVCGQLLNSATGAIRLQISHSAFNTDGFTVLNGSGATSYYVATLCLRGARFKVGSFSKGTGAAPAAQAVTGVGFTPLGLMLASVQDTTTSADHARLGIGAASSTSTENCMAVSDTDNLATSSTDGLDENAASNRIFVKIDNDTQTKDAIASLTSFDSDGFTLSWDTNDAVATKILYIAYAALAVGDNPFVYCHNGETSTKALKSGTTLSQIEQKSWGGGAQAGFGAQFEGAYYLPLGGTVNAQKRTTTAPSTGTDTWSSTGYTSRAFSTLQDGAIARILRAQTNNVAMSLDGTTYAQNFEQGDSSVNISKAVDSGTSAFVAKEDGNVYRFDATGVGQKITNESPFGTSSDNGCGLYPIPGTDACIFTNESGIWFFDGQNRPYRIGLDIIPTNRLIDNVSYEPVHVQHFETLVAGDWIYHITRVVESAVTKSYIEVGQIQSRGYPVSIKWDTPIRFEGVARGLFMDSNNVLWTTFNGDICVYQLGPNGSPDPGRDTIGFGAASTTYVFYGPELTFDTEAYLQHMEMEVRNNGSTTPVQLQYQADGGSATNFGSAQTTSGLLRVYKGTTAIGASRWRPIISVTTTAGYDNTTTTPLDIKSLRMFFRVRAQKADVVHFVIDCGRALANGVKDTDALARRTELKALARGSTNTPAVVALDPDGATAYLNMYRVGDLRLVEIDAGGNVLEEFKGKGEAAWVVDCYAIEWVISQQ